MMRMPVRIFSDLHLGHKASRISDVEKLRQLLKGAGTVVFNGDIWEELVEPCREKSLAMLEELKRIVSEEGCDVIYIRGNHDPGWEGKGWLELADGRIAITHGDALLRDSFPWKHEILSDTDGVDEIWRKHPDAGTDLESRLAVANEIARKFCSTSHPEKRGLFPRILDAAFPPRRALAMLYAWVSQWTRGAEFCERYFPKAEILVIGHFHYAGVRNVRGRTVVNLGSYVVPARPKWAEWDGRFFAMGDVVESSDGYLLGGRTRMLKLL